MTTQEIARLKFNAPLTTEDSEIPDIREEAASLLGYRRSAETPTSSLPPLQAVLARLDIEILFWGDVLRYQQEKYYEHRKAEVEAEIARNEQRPRWHSFSDWVETELQKFDGFVPDHVLQKAVEIKREFPGSHFFVQRLENHPDPFLLVADSGDRWDAKESYYIEVWN